MKKGLTKKLVGWYVSPDKIVSTNVVKLQLPTSMWIHLVINVSQIVWYKEQVKEQKVEKVKSVKVNRVEKWEVE